jgi:hypothetical protein
VVAASGLRTNHQAPLNFRSDLWFKNPWSDPSDDTDNGHVRHRLF